MSAEPKPRGQAPGSNAAPEHISIGPKEIEAAEFYRMLVDNVRDYAIFALDANGYVRTWNRGAQRFKGYEAHEIIGKHMSVFYPPEDIAAKKTEYELRIAEAEGRFEEEGWRVRKDGSQFWANVVITAMRDRSGTLIGFTKVTRDLTERRAAAERAIEDAKRVALAEAANKAKSEFLAAMSHELRTPLNAIGGYVDLLSLGIRGPVNEQQIDDLERIRLSQQHLLGIINDLLNFSRIEAGRVMYDITTQRVSDILGGVRPMIEPQATRRDLTMTWPEPDRSIAVKADKQKLEQVLINLLTNAVKFTPSGGRIDVACGTDGDKVRITVHDNGIGIPPENQRSIFEPFVQVGRTLTSGQEGAGLGLAISRELVHAMAGSLTVESEPGVGSTFTVTLPSAAEAAPTV